VKRALEYWLRAPAATPRQWGAFDPSDFPDSPLGLLLQAACARVRIALGLRVHQSFLAALTSSSQRTLRNHIEAGSLVCEDPTGKHREWITAKSAQAWIESRQK
jgi:hypothetical protein